MDNLPSTYDHTIWKTRDPVRSPIDKPVRAGLVVGSVTTSESPETGVSLFTMIGLSILALYSAVILAVGYFLYRAALPKPIPGIPYNEAAAKHVLGDAPGLLEALTKTGTMLDWLISQLVNRNEPVMQLFLRPLGKPFVIISDFRETQDICVRRSRYLMPCANAKLKMS
jgi:hypothetical protein